MINFTGDILFASQQGLLYTGHYSWAIQLFHSFVQQGYLHNSDSLSLRPVTRTTVVGALNFTFKSLLLHVASLPTHLLLTDVVPTRNTRHVIPGKSHIAPCVASILCHCTLSNTNKMHLKLICRIVRQRWTAFTPHCAITKPLGLLFKRLVGET